MNQTKNHPLPSFLLGQRARKLNTASQMIPMQEVRLATALMFIDRWQSDEAFFDSPTWRERIRTLKVLPLDVEIIF